MKFDISITLAIISVVIATIAFIGQVVITIFEIIHPESYYLIIHEEDDEEDEKDDYERDDKEDDEKKASELLDNKLPRISALNTGYQLVPSEN